MYSQCTPHNKTQSDAVLPHFTKCGEIHINDESTDTFLLCSFCTHSDQDMQFLKTLQEFIDHIKWHRSDDYLCPKDEPITKLEIVELVSASDLSEEPYSNLSQINGETEEGNPLDIAGDVLVNIMDLYKKCPCLWHKESAATNKDIITPTYKMLTNYYNKCTNQSKSVEFVRDFIEKIRDAFLEEFMGGEDTMSDSSSSSPWYFPHLMFLLMCDVKTLDDSIYTDFECTVCSQELRSQEDLWDHLYQCHLELDDEDVSSIGFDDEVDASNYDNDALRQNESQRNVSCELLERFIEAYKAQPRLWNKKDEGYRNRKLRGESYGVLLGILQEHDPAAIHNDVLARIKAFRSKFALERRKIQQHKSSGAEYEPGIWYYKKLLFLVDEVTIDAKPLDRHTKKTDHFSVSKSQEISKTTCSICRKTFRNQTEWLDHVQCAHDSNAFQSADGLFYCPICNVQNRTKHTLIRHLRNTHTNNSIDCHDCGTKYRFMSALAKHRAKVHNDYHPFKCEQCGKGFANLCRMKAHSIIHWNVDDRPHVCEHCGSKFSNRANLKVHIRRHTRDFHLRCEICNHTSATSTELRFHRLTHTKEYPCICDICGKGFRSTALLTTHQNECHSDAMFSCELCDKQFQSVKKLRYHYESHKPVADQECEICGKKFFRSGSVRKHMRLKHQQPVEEVMLFDDLLDDEECLDMDEDGIEQLDDAFSDVQ